MTPAAAPTREQVTAYAEAVWDRDDTIEIRAVGGGGSLWVSARDIGLNLDELNDANRRGANVYVGANPRRSVGTPGVDAKECTEARPCGKCSRCVLLARCLFADFDDPSLTAQDAVRLCDDAMLPVPTIVVRSGHGQHLYWRLDEPLCDLATWSNRQKALAERLGSDDVHDLPRLMRLPGFLNVKAKPFVPCDVVECNADRCYPMAEFPDYAPVHNCGMSTATLPDGQPIREGTRNNTLTSLAGSMRRRGMTQQAILAALLAENATRCKTPLDNSEVQSIAASVSQYPPAAPAAALTTRAEQSESSLLSDVGNAARFASFACDKARWDTSRGWRVWNGKGWELDETCRVERIAKKVVLAIYDEVRHAADESRRSEVGKWAIKSQCAERVGAMLRLTRESLAVRSCDFDGNPWLFNCVNGTIDLRTGELRDHSQADLLTVVAPVEYQPEMPTPIWDRFLSQTFCGDKSLIDFVQCWHGHCLTGNSSVQLMPIYCGSGGNGKSILLDSVCGLMGEYAAEAPPSLLVVTRGAEHPTAVADLRGRRLIVASEPDEGARLKLSLVKQITGNAQLKARYMRQDYFTFDRTHKLVLATNHRPVVHENSEAVWRRLRLVPFNFTVPAGQRDTTLFDKLRREWPGILGWLVRGCIRWLNDGLPDPLAIRTATTQYRSESDIVGEFLAETDALPLGGWIESAELHRQFAAWCNERGEHPFGGRSFTDRLRQHGCSPLKRGGKRGWTRKEELPL